MIVFARKHASQLVQGRAAEDLCLRVVGTARHGQVVRLESPKCTIGSARGCTLRLQAVGVRPLHCIILRGARGTVARCWSRGTRLNGERFVDAPLSPGDRLSIGPIELEVIAAADVPKREEAQDESASPVAAANFNTAAESEGAVDRSQQRADLLTARGRARKLLATIRALRGENSRLRDETANPAPNTQSLDTALPTLAADLEIRIEAFERGCRQWALTRATREAELVALADQQAAELRELETARGALAAARQQWDAECEQARLAAEARDAATRQAQEEFTQAQAELSAAQDVLSRERSEFDRLRETAAETEQEREQQRAELTADFAARVAQLEQEQASWKTLQADDQSRLADERATLEREQAEVSQAKAKLEQLQVAVRGHDEAAEQLVAAQKTLEQDRLAFEKRAAEFETTSEQRRTELAELGAQLEAGRIELAQREAKLATSTTSYETASDEILRLQAEIERQTNDNREQLDAERQQRREELERLSNELAAQRAEAQRQQAAMAEAQARLEQALADLQTQREGLDAERLKAATRMAREEKELQEQRAEFEEQQAAFERMRAALEAQPSGRLASDEDEAGDAEPIRGALGRATSAVTQAEEEEEDEDESPRAAMRQVEEDEEEDEEDPRQATLERGRPGSSPSQDSEEVSVEEYMKALLSRTRGGQPAAAAPAQAAPKRNKRKSDAPKVEEPKSAPATNGTEPTPVIDAQLVPLQLTRRVPVQQTTDLSAMRELANTQARIAIDIHGKKRLMRVIAGSLTAAALAMTVTLTVLIVVSDDTALRSGSMVGIVAAVYWLHGGATALQKMMGLKEASRSDLLAQLAASEARKPS